LSGNIFDDRSKKPDYVMTQDAQTLKAFEAAIGYRSFSFDPVV